MFLGFTRVVAHINSLFLLSSSMPFSGYPSFAYQFAYGWTFWLFPAFVNKAAMDIGM